MSSKILGIVMCFLGMVASGCSSAGGNHLVRPEENGESTWSALERSTVQFAHINWANASAPFERYLLIKDGQFLCAVRFINYWRGRDGRAGSFWSSGEETLSSKYEWDLLEASGVEVIVKSHGTGIVKFAAPWGFGHLILGGGYENIKCDGRDFGWQYPDAVDFSQSTQSDMMLAPSRWTRIEDIRLNDPKLVWYSFDEHRKDKEIPVGDL